MTARRRTSDIPAGRRISVGRSAELAAIRRRAATFKVPRRRAVLVRFPLDLLEQLKAEAARRRREHVPRPNFDVTAVWHMDGGAADPWSRHNLIVALLRERLAQVAPATDIRARAKRS